MSFTFKQVLGIFGGWSAVIIAISVFLNRLLSERLFSKWRREEQAELENRRSALANDRLLLESAVKSLQAGDSLNHEKRLLAVERLWASVLHLRAEFSAAMFFFGILLPEEYDGELRRRSGVALSVAHINDQSIVDALESIAEIERDRPYLGETLWSRFFIYRSFLARLGYLIANGNRKQHIDDWRKDAGVRQMLQLVAPEPTFKSLFNELPAPIGINRAQQFLEALMLEEISLIVSGQRSAFESFEQAKKLQIELAEVVRARAD